MISKSQTACASCNRKKNRNKGGVCRIRKGTDNLSVMCTGNWALHKYHYLNNYLHIFVNSMNKKWGGKICYIDLFSGPGRLILRETEEEIDGSPLIALKYKFAKYIFVDIEKDNIKILKQRCRSRSNFDKVEFIRGDCNKEVSQVDKLIPEKSLSLALIDPFGLNFNFSSYEKFTSTRKVDLIINFPLGMAIKRNYSKTGSKKKLDTFLGGKDWRKPFIRNPTTHFINYYKNNLEKIGYKNFEADVHGEVLIKTIKKEVPLYSLLFTSKHKLGLTFWNKIRKYEPSGQRTLF